VAIEQDSVVSSSLPASVTQVPPVNSITVLEFLTRVIKEEKEIKI
jgi:hypothetical protein